MISTKEHGDKLSITLKPNNSSTVTNNIVFFGLLALLCITFGIGFFFVGAVMILPFAGLEILALFIVLRINRSWVEQTQTIAIDKLYVYLSNSYKKSELKKYARFHSKFIVEKDQTKKVFLIHKKEKLPIGSFLNEEEIEDLIQCLKSKVNDLNYSVR